MIMFNLALMTFFCVLTPINCFPDHYSKPKYFQSVSRGFAAAGNQTDCWVCGAISSSSHTYRYIAVPFTLQDYDTMWNFTESAFSQSNPEIHWKPITKKNEVTEVDYAIRGLICFENDGSGPFLGRSDCQYSLSYWNDSVTVVTPNNTSTFVLSSHTWNVAQPSVNGTMFVCGKNAYNYLPAHWSGSCYFAYVVPVLRLVTEAVHDHISEHATPTQISFLLFPHHGITGTIDDICNVVFTLEEAANSSSLALHSEHVSLREITLQNGMSLELYLAEHGDICSVNETFVADTPRVSAFLDAFVKNEFNLVKNFDGGVAVILIIGFGFLILLFFLILMCCVIIFCCCKKTTLRRVKR